MSIVSIVALLITVAGTISSGTWAIFHKLDDIENKTKVNRQKLNSRIDGFELKIDLNTNGILAIMEKTPHLDSRRFKQAAESNGFRAEDFINEGREGREIHG